MKYAKKCNVLITSARVYVYGSVSMDTFACDFALVKCTATSLSSNNCLFLCLCSSLYVRPQIRADAGGPCLPQQREHDCCPRDEKLVEGGVYTFVTFRQQCPDSSEQVDPGKSKAAITAVLEKLQKTAAANSKSWNNENINQNLFRRYLGGILIQRSSM